MERGGGGGASDDVWRRNFWRWWLASIFQRTWMRLALQVGVDDFGNSFTPPSRPWQALHCQSISEVSSPACLACLQAGLSTLLIMATFSTPAVWELPEYDPVRAMCCW
jgi:hypothetical protein